MNELKENEFKELYDQPDKTEGSHFVDEVQIDTDLALHIPDEYVNNIEERLKLYQRMGELEKEEDLLLFQLELEDRFGPFPHKSKTCCTASALNGSRSTLASRKSSLKAVNLLRTLRLKIIVRTTNCLFSPTS